MKAITRRQFIERAGLAAAGLAVAGSWLSCGRGGGFDPHRVVVVRDPRSIGEDWTVHTESVRRMLDRGIRELAGTSNVGKAWQSFFPGIGGDSTVGIKVNCVVADSNPGSLATHPGVVDAIVQGLLRMPVRGFGPENILVWDRWTAELEGGGFTVNKKKGEGVRCFGTTQAYGVDEDGDVGYDPDCVLSSLEDKAYFSRILSTECDYLVNAPVLKQCGVGVTFALKNNYGTFSTGFPTWQSIGEVFHQEFNRRIVDINAHPVLREKYRLVVGDALAGLKEGGPAGPPGFSYGGLVLSADPVAADAVALSILESEGVETGRGKAYLRAAEEAGLGVANPETFHRVDLDLSR